MSQADPAPELTAALESARPGRALDLACGARRHSRWLTERGWDVMGVDRESGDVHADLEAHEFIIEAAAWDLIVCWLYWQEDLLPQIREGVRPGGLVAMAGKTSGRFATSLAAYRAAFPGWIELSSGENQSRVFFIARYPIC